MLKSSPLRREIAALAARMMAEDGISDFGFAKRKAARQLGVTERDALPNNDEIEAELRAWLGKVWRWSEPRLPGRDGPWAEWPGVTYPW